MEVLYETAAQCNVLLAENLVTRYEGHHDQLSHSFFAMDRFRIYSLCKLLLLENLTIEQRNMTKMILKKKYSIYLQGAKKRNKNSEKLENLLQVAMNISISKNSEKKFFLNLFGCVYGRIQQALNYFLFHTVLKPYLHLLKQEVLNIPLLAILNLDF